MTELGWLAAEVSQVEAEWSRTGVRRSERERLLADLEARLSATLEEWKAEVLRSAAEKTGQDKTEQAARLTEEWQHLVGREAALSEELGQANRESVCEQAEDPDFQPRETDLARRRRQIQRLQTRLSDREREMKSAHRRVAAIAARLRLTPEPGTFLDRFLRSDGRLSPLSGAVMDQVTELFFSSLHSAGQWR